ncbi:STM4015 family protein [Streptomyces sp. NBC_01498]|uniref:STM4015 family protein n=1 Tax=Streptomyces sp. NBC_01498 TaxID=2975870 RepID=UPI002E7B82F1|nr:STM4015 family protein [Streptomyces sp. NBC_01498]WTL23650.1 STM4015 family protein [Streptomyces sp. NBC_01498]
MTISNHLEELDGLPAFDFPDAADETRAELPAAGSVAWRIGVDAYEAEEEWESAFARFVEAVDTTEVRALIVGSWSDAYETAPTGIVAALVAAGDRFPALRALFVGDITFEECEISWIIQTAMAPLINGLPQLRSFGVRGGQSLDMAGIKHAGLRSLTVETGGLDAGVVRDIGAAELPALEHLDIWLGVSWYGANAGVADLDPFLTGARLPALKSLALRNSEIQDEIAAAVAGAPVVARLESLDLSMGTLGDEGAEALLAGQPLTHLKSLDLHHHFLSEPVRERIRAALEPAGVVVDLSDCESTREDDSRYTAVAE